MKTAISVPDDVFQQVERAAKRLGISRSEVFTRAVRRFLAAAQDAEVKASYDAAYAPDVGETDTDEVRQAAARKALLSIPWDDR